ncbi:NUDIX domain-containing protein [Aeromicrobium halocynthiae]|uniref:NUDIX domain-containing protein n=1 Tax=Aeromicrobium halocynthiae TaxID=560557 RepID=A0ABN2W322_9ACTN
MRIPVPPSLAESAAARSGSPVTPRDAATIALVRPGAAGPQTYLLRRQPRMAFAAGQYVFPGGAVQESDADEIGWVGPDAATWAHRLGCTPEMARALVVAAVRETFEESGILLAGPDAHAVASDVSQPWAQDARLALEAGALSLADLLAERGLVLRADLLSAWAHWITPAFEPKRYDTRFFVAVAPEGQRVGSLPGEADRAHWVGLADAVQAVEEGRAAMLPPTLVTCRELATVEVHRLHDVAADRVIEPIEPRLVEVDGELFLENPIEET